MSKYLVTVCIPTYNGEKYFKECLDSIQAQTFTDFEVLIVDDCSSDNTVKIAQEYANCDPRITIVINQQNLGLVGNWNRCAQLAQGEWLKYVFQDDLIAPTCLEKMLAFASPDTSIICCKRDFLFSTETSQKTKDNYLKILTLESYFSGDIKISAQQYCQVVLNNLTESFIGEKNLIGEPTVVMLHHSVFEKFGLFNQHLIQIGDLEFWTRIGVNTGITYVEETLATFRVHEESATFTNNNTSRNYRSFVLDSLVFLYDFTFNPRYESLRNVAISMNFPLETLLRKKACKGLLMAELPDNYWVKSYPEILTQWHSMERHVMIKLATTDSTYSKRVYLNDWKNIVKFYPKLEALSERSLVEKKKGNIILILKSAKAYLKRRLKKK